ncbi:MAG: hypothetical protein ACWGSD_17155, partial [Thermodesulfobacteriota bacterium]
MKTTLRNTSGEGVPPQWREYSEETARRVDEAVEQTIDGCYQRARTVLDEHRADLDRVALEPDRE